MWKRLLTILMTLVFIAACGGAGTSTSRDPSADKARIYELLVGTGQGSLALPVSNITEALPGARFADRDISGSISDAVLLGRVTDVNAGSAFVLDGPTDSPVPFDAQDADGRFANVTIQVDKVVCSTAAVSATVAFKFLMEPADTLDGLKAGFGAMGPILVFVKSPSPQQSSSDVYQPALVPGLLSEVTDSGQLPLPAAKELLGNQFLTGGTSVDELTKACQA